MHKWRRPEKRDDFDGKVDAARTMVSIAIASMEKVDFPDDWAGFKEYFTKAQAGKCGFCEGRVWGLQHGDVEHFQPKAEVRQLVADPNLWGREMPWRSTVVERETTGVVLKPGYWWRAYHWDNYLLACQVCNQLWKKNLYPVKASRVLLPTTDGGEEPLLLSPFDDDFEPSLHFSYGRLGDIRGLSEHGLATIVTCGLDRPSLRLARYKLALGTHLHLDEIAGDVTERDVLRVLRCIARDGDEQQEFCGMVRTIFVQRTGLPWERLDDLVASLAASAMPERPLCDC